MHEERLKTERDYHTICFVVLTGKKVSQLRLVCMHRINGILLLFLHENDKFSGVSTRMSIRYLNFAHSKHPNTTMSFKSGIKSFKKGLALCGKGILLIKATGSGMYYIHFTIINLHTASRFKIQHTIVVKSFQVYSPQTERSLFDKIATALQLTRINSSFYHFFLSCSKF